MQRSLNRPANGRSGSTWWKYHLRFLKFEQVEWSANTYGLDLDMVPQAMQEVLKGMALKWFIAKNKQWRTWAEFIESFHTYFPPRDFFTRLAGQVRQRKQGFSE